MSAQAPESDQGAPIGPGSLLWENVGRSYNLLVAVSAGILQNMHPEVAAGVDEHSRVFEDPGERLAASMDPILRTIYGPEPDKTGQEIRDIHKDIRSGSGEEPSYHALKPETWWWTHATFEEMTVEGRRRFSGSPFERKEKQQVHRESITWLAGYGVTLRAIPPTREEHEAKMNDVYENVLEMTPVAAQLIRMFQEGEIQSFVEALNIDPRIYRFGSRVMAEAAETLAIGGLPKAVRERFDIPFSKTDELKLRAMDAAARVIAPQLSEEHFYLPAALEGIRRERANQDRQAEAT